MYSAEDKIHLLLAKVRLKSEVNDEIIDKIRDKANAIQVAFIKEVRISF